MRKALFIAMLCIALEASAFCSLEMAFLAEGDHPPPVDLIVATYQRLLTELSTALAQSKRLHEFEKMLAAKGWLTPEVMQRLGTATEAVHTDHKTAAESLKDALENQTLAFRLDVHQYYYSNVSANRRWIAYPGWQTQDRHQMIGNLETGEQFDLGPTDGQWAYANIAMSDTGDAIAVGRARKGWLRVFPFPAGQPKFTDPILVKKSWNWPNPFPSVVTSPSLQKLRAGPAPHLWLAEYAAYASGYHFIYVFDSIKKTGKPISVKPIGATQGDQLSDWGTVPGTNRMYFQYVVPRTRREAEPMETWTAEVDSKGNLSDVKKIAQWSMANSSGLTTTWSHDGKNLYRFNPSERAVLQKYSEGSAPVNIPIVSPLGPNSRLVDVYAAEDDDSLSLLFTSEDGKSFQPVHYSLKSGKSTWSKENRFGPSEKRPFFTKNGERVVYQKNASIMESLLLLDPDEQ